MTKYLYYPGCSQKSSAKFYEKAFIAVCETLGIELIELNDWSCCGTTVAISTNKLLSLALAARNLALSEPQHLSIITPCPSCYVSLKRVNHIMNLKNGMSEKVNEILAKGNCNYTGQVEVFHALDFLINKIGTDAIMKHIKKPLKDLKIAPYYGCQLASPYADCSNNKGLTDLERLIELLGARPIDFNFKTQCCGGSLMFTRKDQAMKMCRLILNNIYSANADIIVTPCGLCQLNLEMAQERSKTNKKLPPVLNICQLIGLAFDINSRTIHTNNIKRQLVKI